MRICIAGSYVRSVNFANYLVANGHEVHVIPSADLRAFDPSVILHREFIGRLHLASLAGVLAVPMRGCRFRALVRAIRPDILHAFFIPWQGWYSALSGYHPFVLTTMGSDITNPGRLYRNPLHRILNPYTVRQADAVTVVNRQGYQRVKEMDPGKEPIYFRAGADSRMFHRTDRPAFLVKSLSIPEGLVVLSPRGLNRPLYNIETIVDGFHGFLSNGGRGVLLIMGKRETPYAEKIRAYVRARGLSEHVRFCGTVDQAEMNLYYSLADVVVSMPFLDGAPATVFECYACGKPLIVARNPSIAEIFVANENGFVVEPTDSESVARKLTFLDGHPETRRKIGANNVQESTRHEPRLYNERVLAVYQSLHEAAAARVTHAH